MFFFWRKKKENHPFVPLATGRLETTYDKLKEDYGASLSGRIYDFDISAFTEEYTDPIKVPTKIQVAVRQVMDDHLKEGQEFYFQLDEKVFGVFFGHATKALAELKIQVIRNEVSAVIGKIKRKAETRAPQEACATINPPAKEVVKDTNTAKKGWGTLSDEPDEEEMRNWASRALANMTTQFGPANFKADVEQLSNIIKVQYKPLWYQPNQIVSGYVIETTAPLSNETYEGKQSQEDLAILAAAQRHLKAMIARKEYALVIVPISIGTICNPRTCDLFNLYCRSLEPAAKRFFVLRIRDMDPNKMTESAWAALKALPFHCRSIIIDAQQKKINIDRLVQMQFHAFGFDLATLRLPEDQIFEQINDFSRYYKYYRKDIFLMGISTVSLASAAIANGYTYLSGPAIMPYKDQPAHACFVDLFDIYDRHFSLPPPSIELQ